MYWYAFSWLITAIFTYLFARSFCKYLPCVWRSHLLEEDDSCDDPPIIDYYLMTNSQISLQCFHPYLLAVDQLCCVIVEGVCTVSVIVTIAGETFNCWNQKHWWNKFLCDFKPSSNFFFQTSLIADESMTKQSTITQKVYETTAIIFVTSLRPIFGE